MQIDLRVTELLASRLCHDLVGPIGAVSNGLELMADESFGMADDALALASNSAGQATHLLQFYRLAYGMAGNRQGSDLKPLRELAANFLAHSKGKLEWPADAMPSDLPDGCGKLILNMIALALEALPRGGTIGVGAKSVSGGAEIEIKAVGADAGLRPESQAALSLQVPIDDLTPRNVHGYFTRLIAEKLGASLVVEPAGAGYLRLTSSPKA